MKMEYSKIIDLTISLFVKCLSFYNTALALFNLKKKIMHVDFPSIFIPRYLKYFVLYNLFLHNVSLKLVSQGFPLILKSLTSVFPTFNTILFAFSQNESSFKSTKILYFGVKSIYCYKLLPVRE